MLSAHHSQAINTASYSILMLHKVPVGLPL